MQPLHQNAPTRRASRRILLLCFKRRSFLPPVYILSELSSALFGNESLAGKVNLAVGFDFDYANKNLIADADNILYALNALVGELRNMNKTLLSGFQLNLCADGKNIHNLAENHITDLNIANDIVDNVLCFFSRCRIGACDEHPAVILDIDLDTGFGNDAVDGFAAAADNFANLIGVDAELQYTRCKRGKLGARSVQAHG